ncbi:MAG: hypothetical protein IPN76_00590 [Saprospiraceae bacterium]|nr:hypothetical protein [Saprospiraceae bacterium]
MNKQRFPLYVLLLVSCFAFGQAPTGLSGTGYRTTVHLKWDGYTAFQPVGYNIYRSTVSNNFGAPARRIGAYSDYTDYGLSASTTYYYKVSAFDGAGNESALSNQITVSTNNNNYQKISSLDIIVPIFMGGLGPNEPQEVRQGLEFARQFYFRNSFGKLNLKFHFWDIPGDPLLNSEGVADFGTMDTDFRNRGILDNQYDAIFLISNKTLCWCSNGYILGQTAPSMAHYGWFDPTDHYTKGDAWLFTHEFGHSLDFMIAGGSGYGDWMLVNHPFDAFPLPSGIDKFDCGPGFDNMAEILRIYPYHLNYAEPWGGYFEALDTDGDGLANSDERLPYDEADFGSNPNLADADADGLNDLKEFHAGNFSGSNPLVADTDGDGLLDGADPYPISDFTTSCQKTTGTVTINGTMNPAEGWKHMATGPRHTKIPGAALSTFTTWDDNYLYFAFQSNKELKYYLSMDGSGEDGLFSSDKRFTGGSYGAGYNDDTWGDSYYETAVFVIRSDAAQVIFKNAALAGSQVSTTNSGGVYTTEVRIPLSLGPGFGYTYTPASAPIVSTTDFVQGDIIGIELHAILLSDGVGNNFDDWGGVPFLFLNEPFHFYDMTLTGGGPATYCASTSNFPWEDWIAKVKVGTIVNVSGKSKYSDFTSLSTNLNTGSTPIELTTGFSYFTWDEYWRVWIDLNHDGDFADAGETVFEGIKAKPANGTATSTLTGNLNIPATAMTGATRMRVSMKRGAYATPCETLPFGEVEDYTVNLGGGPINLANLAIPYYEAMPGPGGGCIVQPGGNFNYFEALMLNTGTGNAGPFEVKVLLSKDDQPSTGDLVWKTYNYSGLAPNGTVSFSFLNEPLPAAATLGRYNLLVFADAQLAVPETNELDNVKVVPITVGAPDFTVSAVNGVPATLPLGGNLNFSATVRNLAGFPITELPGELALDVYLSTDAQFSLTDNLVGWAGVPFSNFSNGPLYLNGIATANFSFPLPPDVVQGSYFLFVKIGVNQPGGCVELSTDNNVSSAIPLQITGGTPGTYCASTSNFPWEDWIAKVKLGTINNASGKSAYSDFTSISTSLTSGSTPIELTTGFSYFTFDEYWRAWVDLNHDGDFADAGETVFEGIKTKPANGTATATLMGNISIPASAMTGDTRMRVSMKRGAYATPCETLPFGEVEDYAVSIGSGGGSCAISVQVSNISCNGNYAIATLLVTAQNAGGQGWVAVVGTPGGPVYVTGLYGEPKTASFYKGTDNAAYVNVFDPNISSCITNVVLNCPAIGQYCESKSNFPWEDWISKVKLNSLDNTSGKSTYSDFTALSTNLQKGQSYTVTLTTGYSYFTWDEYWRVWIDFNHDGVFSTPDEVVQQRVLSAPAAGTSNASVSGSINIPTSALSGSTRMRVSMKRGSYASACETLPFGEVEDYTVNIVNSLTGDDLDNRAAKISFEAVPEKTWVSLYGVYHFAEPVVQIEMEKSVDGQVYELLESAEGKAKADNAQVVQVRDERPNDGFNFYRMLILLENGDEVYSPVRVVSYNRPLDYTVFPNPASTEVFVQLAEVPKTELELRINDAYGRVVWSHKTDPDAQFPYRIDVTNLRDGSYYLLVVQPERRAVGKRFVVVK